MLNSMIAHTRRLHSRVRELRICGWARNYASQKRAFDIVVSCSLLVVLAPVCMGLLVLNPWLNRGPLFFLQDRMGKNCQRFTTWKLRSMTVHETESRIVPDRRHACTGTRGAFDPLDRHRITRLGHLLRRTRIDELPQIINVLRGEMSLIGPRPDAFSHAQTYLHEVPGYRARFSMVPGISGLAQVNVGYVDDHDGVVRKVEADLHYLAIASIWIDLWIARRTVATVLGFRGR